MVLSAYYLIKQDCCSRFVSVANSHGLVSSKRYHVVFIAGLKWIKPGVNRKLCVLVTGAK